MKALLLVPVILLVFFSKNTFPQCGFINETELNPSGLDFGDKAGTSVSIFDDLIAVGAPFDENNQGIQCGAVYIYRRFEIGWVEIQKIAPEDGALNDEFGFEVHVSNNALFVGSPKNDEFSSNAGAVYVYSFDNGQYQLEEKLLPIDPTFSTDNHFGFSIDQENDTLIISATGDNNTGVYVFTKESNWVFSQKIGGLGFDVDLNYPYIIVGDPFHNYGGAANRGKAIIYSFNGSLWETDHNLLGSDVPGNYRFGSSVAILNNQTVAVGSSLNLFDEGKVYIFGHTGNAWEETQIITNPVSFNQTTFGSDIFLDESILVISAKQQNFETESIQTGAVHTFLLNDGIWEPESSLYASDISGYDKFGTSIDMFEGTLVVGAAEDDDNAENEGSAYVYKTSPECPNLTIVLTSGCTNPDAVNYNPYAQIDNGSCYFVSTCYGDLNNDGQVTISDLLDVINTFGTSCD